MVDDGHGFDVAEAMANPEPGHFGLQLLADLASGGGAVLQVASAPGRGTHWRLQLVVEQVAPGTRRRDLPDDVRRPHERRAQGRVE